jgi:hypothetical protein
MTSEECPELLLLQGLQPVYSFSPHFTEVFSSMPCVERKLFVNLFLKSYSSSFNAIDSLDVSSVREIEHCCLRLEVAVLSFAFIGHATWLIPETWFHPSQLFIRDVPLLIEDLAFLIRRLTDPIETDFKHTSNVLPRSSSLDSGVNPASTSDAP